MLYYVIDSIITTTNALSSVWLIDKCTRGSCLIVFLSNLYQSTIILGTPEAVFLTSTHLHTNNKECLNSIILLSNKNLKLFFHKQIENNTILIFDELPITIEKLLDVINTKLIKKKYNFQSKFKIKNYALNLNSRIISNKNDELKLTEREIDIILFLNENKTPQSVDTLQNKVWGHLFDLETHTVETHIYRLRKKIKEKFNDINFIISHDDGYVI